MHPSESSFPVSPEIGLFAGEVCYPFQMVVSDPQTGDLPDTAVTKGRILGDYELHDRLADHCGAETFLAHNLLADRPCILKVFKKNCARSMVQRGRYVHQAKRILSLNNSQICRWFGIYQTPQGRFYTVTNLMPGRPLLDHIQGDVSPHVLSGSLTFASALLGPLQAIHSLGLWHGRLHPRNIMVGANAESATAHVSLLDSSILQLYPGENPPSAPTQAISPFLAPEVLAGQAGDQRSDIYSLSRILKHIYLHDEHGLQRAEESKFAERLVPLIENGLNASPERRPASISEFARFILPQNSREPLGPRPRNQHAVIQAPTPQFVPNDPAPPTGALNRRTIGIAVGALSLGIVIAASLLLGKSSLNDSKTELKTPTPEEAGKAVLHARDRDIPAAPTPMDGGIIKTNAPVGSATLIVMTPSTDSEITVNGKRVGGGKVKSLYRMPAGKYQIQVRIASKVFPTRIVELKKGQRLKVFFRE